MILKQETLFIEKQVLNEKTGELEFKLFEEKSQRKQGVRGGFCMLYKSYEEACFNVFKSVKEAKILHAIKESFTYRRVEVVIDRKAIANKFGTSLSVVNKIIANMVAENILMRVSRGVYRLNPYMYLPYKSDGISLQSEWNQLKQS